METTEDCDPHFHPNHRLSILSVTTRHSSSFKCHILPLITPAWVCSIDLAMGISIRESKDISETIPSKSVSRNGMRMLGSLNFWRNFMSVIITLYSWVTKLQVCYNLVVLPMSISLISEKDGEAVHLKINRTLPCQLLCWSNYVMCWE